MNYAIIKFDPNSSALGEIISPHRTEQNAEKALDKLGEVRNHYVAHRKTNGEWERYLEARDRWEAAQ